LKDQRLGKIYSARYPRYPWESKDLEDPWDHEDPWDLGDPYKLTLNVSKTKYFVFRNKSMLFDDQGYNLKIGNEIIERICSTCKDKYLKFVDEFLICNYQLDGIYQVKFLPWKVLKSLKNFLRLLMECLLHL